MGIVDGISATEFPVQGSHLNRRVTVCFNYDTSRTVGGTVVRDDTSAPHIGIIRLDDGRHVLMTECMYSIPPAESADTRVLRCNECGHEVPIGDGSTCPLPGEEHNCERRGHYRLVATVTELIVPSLNIA